MLRLALAVHLLAVIFWVGGMAFVRFALAPAMARALAPPQRLPLLVAILQRFLAGVTLAIVLIVLSGLAIIALSPASAARPAVHAMAGIGVLMIAIFGVIRLRHFPALRRAAEAADWPAAGRAAAALRRLVDVNLGLGIITVALPFVLS